MGTRAMYTFLEKGARFNVYKHHDGYPEGAAEAIRNALSKAWELPRFEADEFAAAFVAANKTSSGGVRLMSSGTPKTAAPSDIEFRYVIQQDPQVNRLLRITVFSTDYGDPRTEKKLFAGSLSEFENWAAAVEQLSA